MSFDLGNLLQQYLGGANPNANPAQAENDFDHVAQNVPRATVAQGVTQALRSDQPDPARVGRVAVLVLDPDLGVEFGYVELRHLGAGCRPRRRVVDIWDVDVQPALMHRVVVVDHAAAELAWIVPVVRVAAAVGSLPHRVIAVPVLE